MKSIATKPPEGPEDTLKPFADIGNAFRATSEQDGRSVLMAGECGTCGKRSFPRRELCPYCAESNITEVALPSSGTLYSYTTVHVSSARPTPYTIGYVDLDRNVRTLALITGDIARLRPDMSMHLIVTNEGWSFVPSPAGSEVV